MYYESLAYQLLNLRVKMLQVPAHKEISKLMRGEMFVLNYLKEHDGVVHPKELSEKLAVSTARIARLLKHMEEQGTDANDSRQVVVRMTEQGASEIDHIRKKVLEHTTRMLENLGVDDAKEYIRIQEKICQNCSEIRK